MSLIKNNSNKQKHPLNLKNYVVLTNGCSIIINSPTYIKKKIKFLDVDTLNNKLWANHNKNIMFTETKSRLNKFNSKFK